MEMKILEAKLSKKQIPQVYASKVAVYDIWGKLTESKAQRRCIELAAIQDGEAVLEVAVGTGLTFSHVLQRNSSGINEGVDLTEAMLAQARKKAAQSGRSNYRLRIGDAYALDFADNTFDVLINNYMFDLIPEKNFNLILAEFKRVLKPGGRLLLVNMAGNGRWYNKIWEIIYRIQPSWLGGCRGVSMIAYVHAAGFRQTTREFVSQMTFPSEVIYGIKGI
jgi:ubiquinone/menaquinone biosynthesis C-methylase UbiE